MKTVLYFLVFCLTALFVMPTKNNSTESAELAREPIYFSPTLEDLRCKVQDQEAKRDSLIVLTRKNLAYFKQKK